MSECSLNFDSYIRMKTMSRSKINRIGSTPISVNTNSTISDIARKSSCTDLHERVKGLINLGKVIGVIPCEAFFKKDTNCCCGQSRSWMKGSIISWSISITMLLNAVVAFIGMIRTTKSNAADLAWAGAAWVYYSYGTFLYVYFIQNVKEFCELFSKWTSLELHATLHDKSLSRDVGVITGLVFVSAVLENALLQFIEFPAFEEGMNNSMDRTLETYYQTSYNHWANLIPYHWTLPILCFLSNKVALYAWNFVDILIAALSRAISAKFRLLYEDMEQRLANVPQIISENCYEGSKHEELSWIQLARDHLALCNLMNEFEAFLSPLIFCSYGINIYFACLQILLGITPAKDLNLKSTLHSIYASWSFIHLLARLYIVTISAAKINVHAHKIYRVLRMCPSDKYVLEVERLERKVTAGADIGLTGLGCFTITKPFILSIIGVVFTFEIVLMQASYSAQSLQLNGTNCTGS